MAAPDPSGPGPGGNTPRAPTSAPGGSGAGERDAARAPPFRIPGQHFAAALAFFVSGAIVLTWRAPALAAGAFTDRWLVAGVHLLTLGWISTSIMGALYQLLPVALGASIRWRWLTHLTFYAWTAAVVAFVAGLGAGVGALTLTGGGLLGAAILLFTANLWASLRRARRRSLTWWCVAGASGALVGAWVLGLLLAVNLSSDLLGESRMAVLAVHLHLAAGGWVLLTMIGVAHRLLPMFLLSHGAGDGPGKVGAGLVGAGTAGLLLSEHLLPVGVLRPALALLAAGATAFLVQAFLHYRRRRRPRLDPGMRLVAAGLVFLGLAVTAGTASLVSAPTDVRLLVAYGVLLIPGGLGLFVAGHYYKIVPFLTWFHRFGPVAAERDVPKVEELFDHRLAHGAAALLVGGVGLMALGAFFGRPTTTGVGGAAFGLGAATQSLQMVGVARRRPR